MSLVMLFSMMFYLAVPSYATTTVKVGEACSSATKTVRSYKATYSSSKSNRYHWTYVIHATDKTKRNKIAYNMENAIRKAGYISYSDQKPKSYTLYTDLENKNFDCSKLKKNTSTNCCNLASVCCNYAGYSVPKNLSSTKLNKQFKDIKGFEVKKYGKSLPIYRGDILVNTESDGAHTCVALE